MAEAQDKSQDKLFPSNNVWWQFSNAYTNLKAPFQHGYFLVNSYVKPEEFTEEAIGEQCMEERGFYRLRQLKLSDTKIMDPKFLLEEELRYVYANRDYWKGQSELVEIEIDALLNKISKVKLEYLAEINLHSKLAFRYQKENADLQMKNKLITVKDNKKEIEELNEQLIHFTIENKKLFAENNNLKTLIDNMSVLKMEERLSTGNQLDKESRLKLSQKNDLQELIERFKNKNSILRNNTTLANNNENLYYAASHNLM